MVNKFFIAFMLAFVFTVNLTNTAAANVSEIGSERIVKVANYCVARGSGGRDGYGSGRYVAPSGYSIVSAEMVTTKCRKCSQKSTTYTQPGFVSLKQATGVDYSKAMTDFAGSLDDKSMSLKLLAVTGAANTVRVVEGTTHAVVEHKCHCESHRRVTGNKNGWGYYDLHLKLRREATTTDYATLMLNLVTATEEGDTEKFKALVKALESAK